MFTYAHVYTNIFTQVWIEMCSCTETIIIQCETTSVFWALKRRRR